MALAIALSPRAAAATTARLRRRPPARPVASTDQPGKGKPAVTIGDKNFTEQYILGELYAQALRAKGFTVKLKSNIGSSEIIDKALTSAGRSTCTPSTPA